MFTISELLQITMVAALLVSGGYLLACILERR